MAQNGVHEVTTTIEKCGLEEGRELQWQIRNFNVIRSSCLGVIRQNFGPLNGKVTLKLDLTRLSNGAYELGVQAEPLQNIMWMNVQFKMHGNEVTEFAVSGDPRAVTSNRLVYTLEIPSLETVKFTFVPEVLISVSNVVGGSAGNAQQSSQGPTPPPFNTDWVQYLPPWLQHVVNQRVSEGQHWANFFRDYPTEFAQLQRSLVSTFTNSELINEAPRMFQSLITELVNNPDYANAQQRLNDLISGAQRHAENLAEQARQNRPPSDPNAQSEPQRNVPSEPQQNAPSEPQQPSQQNAPSEPRQNAQQTFGNFPPVVQGLQTLIHQNLVNVAQHIAPQQNAEPTQQNSSQTSTERNVQQDPIEMLVRSEEFAAVYDAAISTYNSLVSALHAPPSQPEPTQQPSQQQARPTAPPAEVETTPVVQETEPQPPLIDLTMEESEPVQSTSAAAKRPSVSSNADWTFLFTAKGITGYVRHIKNLGSRVPYHRNFCSSDVWSMPDGQSLKVELVHALHPDAPFICLIDYNDASEMAFVQTLLDGNGQEIHKIDSFSNSYHGFTSDQLIQSAEIDDVVRIKIEAIPNMD